jgi:hypothetical protein
MLKKKNENALPPDVKPDDLLRLPNGVFYQLGLQEALWMYFMRLW